MAEKFICPFCNSNITLNNIREGQCTCGAIIEENSAGEVCVYPPEDSFSKGTTEQKVIDVTIKPKDADNTTATTAVDNKKTENAGANAPKTLSELCAEQGLTLDGTTVTGCDKDATEVIIPEGVTLIGDNAFEKCRSIKSIVIPESVTEIGYKAFCECKSLESIAIPNSVTVIVPETFSGCSSLKSINIPESVICIGEKAFECCSSLKRIEIPESVIYIGDEAFFGCSGLSEMTLPLAGDKIKCIRFMFEPVLDTYSGDYRNFVPRKLKKVTINGSGGYIGSRGLSGCSPKLKIIVKGGKERTMRWATDWNVYGLKWNLSITIMSEKRYKTKYKK